MHRITVNLNDIQYKQLTQLMETLKENNYLEITYSNTIKAAIHCYWEICCKF